MSDRRKKLLVLTPRFPYPVVGGDRLRIYFVCKQLSETFDITLLSLCESREELELVVPDDGVFVSVQRVYLPKWRSLLNCLLALVSGQPLQVAYYRSSKFQSLVNRQADEHDICLAHLIRTGEYLFESSVPKILEMTDAISLNYSRVAATRNVRGIRKVIYRYEGKRLRDYELSVIDRFDRVALVSAIDRDFLLDEADSRREKVIVCSNGVALDSLPYSYEPSGNVIVFIGNMNTLQNMDAALWFAREVMPLLVDIGDFSFRVVGRIGRQGREELESCPGVVVTGGVDSVAEASRGAFAGVCPMRIGAGVQNKVLEYMALGLPAVTSSLGREGIDAEAGREILVADSAQQFVEQLQNLRADTDFARAVSRDGRQFVEANHSWEQKLAPMVAAARRITEDGR